MTNDRAGGSSSEVKGHSAMALVSHLKLHKGAVRDFCAKEQVVRGVHVWTARPKAAGDRRTALRPQPHRPSFTTWFVVSRNSVSLGDILWKTTF